MDNKNVDDRDSERPAGRASKGKMGWKSYLAITAAAAFLVMMIIVSVRASMPIPAGNRLAPNSQSLNDQTQNENAMELDAIAAPEYPAKTKLYSDNFKPQGLDANFVTNLQNFLSQSSSAVLSAEDPGSNQIFSPVSLYMAMAMTASGANEETRNEILNTMSMGNFDMETINRQTKQLFQNLYFDNDVGHLKLADSLWLDKRVPFKQDFLQSLAKGYYAYSFSADFSDTQKTLEQINKWIAENTGGKLGQDKKSQLEFKPEDNIIMAILNTVYFYDEWTGSFDHTKTAEDVFHLADGTTAKAEFMNTTDTISYLKGSNYTASYRNFANGGKMVFILPDQGVSPYDLIKSPQFIAGTVNDLFSDQSQEKEVAFKVPKFKYENHFGLTDTLKKMGINKAFLDTADFLNIADLKPLYIAKVEQAAYISVDELGCEAAAYTAVLPRTGGGPENLEKVDMILDRPFIFVLTLDGGNPGNVPLFVGIVNNPAEQ